MDRDEVRRYLDVSLVHSIVIDVQEVPEAPGTLRSIMIHEDQDVTIEYQTCAEYVTGDSEGGGLKYIGHYDAMDELVEDIEEYLGKPIEQWHNFTATPFEPEILSEPNPEQNLRYFEDLVRDRRLSLPRRGEFEVAGIHWRHIELFGEYRPDKLMEEMEHHLKKHGIPLDDDEDEPERNVG